MHLSKKTTFRLLAALLVGLAVLGLDFGVRQVYKKIRKPPIQPEVSHRESSPYYHHGLRPNAAVMDTFGNRKYSFFSNSLGMRDGSVREVPPKKVGPRILLMGDSFTEGVGFPWEKTFAGILASRLAETGVEVLNSGVNSYCPILFQGRLKYLMDQRGLEVDRVIIFVDISDIMQELIYRLNADGSIQGQPLFPEIASETAEYNQRERWLRTTIEDQFVIFGAIVRNIRLWFRDHRAGPAIRKYDEIPGWAFEWPDYRGPYEALIQKGMDLAFRHMTEIAADLKRRGVALTVVIYPWPQQIRAGSRPSRAEMAWGAWSRSNNIPMINLFPAFVSSTPAEEVISRFYLKNDSHWNEQGHAKVAQALLDSKEAVLPPNQK